MTKRLLTVLGVCAVLALLATLSACNTVEGVGRDVEAAGEGLSNAAHDANPDN